jgi:hypothetical protein
MAVRLRTQSDEISRRGPILVRQRRTRMMRTRRKMWMGLGATLFVVLIGVSWCAASFSRLELPVPSGPHAVGRMRLSWGDDKRPELFMPQSRCEVIASVRSHARANAGFATLDACSPVVILSPGNATNVEFYSAIAVDGLQSWQPVWCKKRCTSASEVSRNCGSPLRRGTPLPSNSIDTNRGGQKQRSLIG